MRRKYVATLEERVAFLEGRVAEHSRGVDGIRDALVHLEERMDRRFEGVDARFQSLDVRLDGMERRLDGLDTKMERRFAGIEDKLSRSFVWLVGIQVTTLAAMVTALATR